MIQLTGVSKAYGTTIAVDGLCFDVSSGEVFAFLGPNGAGKTTTIKMIVGLLLPDAGRITIGDFDVCRQRRDASALIGYIPDQPYLYERLTGREFLQLMADLYGMPAIESRTSIQEQVEQFGLGEFIDRQARTYSHGMKQRLVFAAALVHRPQVLVLDEPMVGLDPASGRAIKDLLRRCAEAGMAVFMSTHTLPMAEEIADRLAILQNGRLRFLGTVAQLRAQVPAESETLEGLFLNLTES